MDHKTGPHLRRRDLLGAAAAGFALPTILQAGTTQPKFRVTDFGAKGLGMDEDAGPAIQAAINAAASQGGGTVYFDAPPKFFHVGQPLRLWPKVSLAGDGSYPEIRTEMPAAQLLFIGSFHPAFVQTLRFDRLGPIPAGATTVRLSDSAASARYRVGDQIILTNTDWGRTGPFGLPRYAWLNYVVAKHGSVITLREAVDVAVTGQIAPLKEGRARFNGPLFFYSDGEVSGLTISCRYHPFMDSAALHMRFHDNVVRARSGIYGNSFQGVEWTSNKFFYTNMLAELSENSLNNLISGNEFHYVGSTAMPEPKNQYQGMYFQEYARNMTVRDNVSYMNDFSSHNFAISIALAQNVVVERLRVYGKALPAVIYMGAQPQPGFDVSGNFIRNSVFDPGRTERYIYVDGHQSADMRGNGIENCAFLGTASQTDAVRMVGVQGGFSFKGNRLPQPDTCFTMRQSSAVDVRNNIAQSGKGMSCRALS